MTLTLQLTSEQDSKLRQFAAIHGLDASEFAHHVLLDRLAQESSAHAMTTPKPSDEWLDKFSALIDDMKIINAPSSAADALRRESIYEDRGL